MRGNSPLRRLLVLAKSMLRRLISSKQVDPSREAAEAVLAIHFSDAQQERIAHLASRSNFGLLTPDEATEYDNLIAAADLLSLAKAKARLKLRHR